MICSICMRFWNPACECHRRHTFTSSQREQGLKVMCQAASLCFFYQVLFHTTLTIVRCHSTFSLQLAIPCILAPLASLPPPDNQVHTSMQRCKYSTTPLKDLCKFHHASFQLTLTARSERAFVYIAGFLIKLPRFTIDDA